MTSAAKFTLRLVFFLAISLQAHQAASEDPVQAAEEEAVRRQEATMRLHMKLDQAVAAQKRNQLDEAAKLYQEAVSLEPLVQAGSPAVDLWKKQALAGLDAVEVKMARQAMDRGEMEEALARVAVALKADPNNENLRKLKMEVEKRTVGMKGTVPDPDLVKTTKPEVEQEKIEIATKVQNAKLFYEMGKYNEAEIILREVMKEDPSNKTAPYYLDLVAEAKFAANARTREFVAKTNIMKVEEAWIPSTKRDSLPIPNPMATTNLVYTSPGRQEILSKLERIHFSPSYPTGGLPLNLVLDNLRSNSILRDADRVGINFMWNPHADAPPTATDTTGNPANNQVPAPAAPPEESFNITISPPLNNLRFSDVLDAITKVAVNTDPNFAQWTVKYSIEEYAIIFAPKPPDLSGAALYTKVFKVNPNTFVQGLQNVSSITLNTGGGSGTIGGQGTGGSTSSGGGTGTGGNGTSTGVQIPSVSISPVTQGGTAGGGAVQTGGANRVGLEFVTKTNNTSDVDIMVKNYFKAAGVDLSDPGKAVFFNDRLGELMIRATLSDLEIIEEAIEMLNQSPPQLTIEAKFVELSQEDSRAIGFNWYWGNTLVNNGAIGVQGGTAPSYQGAGTTANPSGIFPGPGTLNANGTYTPGPGAASSSAADNNLTAGLLNQYTFANSTGTIPTVATITGIMTDPQFRVAINAIQTRTGSDLLYAPKVTTLSGRQAHIAAQELQTIVVNSSVSTSSSSTGTGLVAGTGVVVPEINYNTSAFGLGPVLDVLPSICADGFSIQMALLPTVLEFIGYDSPGAFVPESVAAAGGSIGTPITAQLALPHFRVRDVATTCNVWDGQTVVLGGMISESITKVKSQIPVLGDLPLVGRLFQNSSTDSVKQNLMIFVTPTIIDPSGNRVHNDDDMPFAKNSIPTQPPAAAQ